MSALPPLVLEKSSEVVVLDASQSAWVSTDKLLVSSKTGKVFLINLAHDGTLFALSRGSC